MPEYEYTDLTDRARAMNEWTFDGLTVRAHAVRDDESTPFDADCYTPEDIDAWRRDVWEFVGVIVEVIDSRGMVWGMDSLWGLESGTYLVTNDSGTVTGTQEINPLTDPLHPLPEMIRQAMGDAAENLAGYTLPTITVPAP